MNLLNYNIKDYLTESGVNRKNINITYQLFGKPLHSASIVLVNHALTGNSDVAGQKKGWWKDLVGINKLIDTSRYTVLAFDIPG
ncbi:MAG: homoserine acetyltransferase, partial [Bacilli bacterium]